MAIQSVNSSLSFGSKSNIKDLDVNVNPQKVVQEVGKTNKKKMAVIGGLAALAIAGTVAAIAIVNHKKVPSDVKKALDSFEATNALAESTHKQVDEIVENCKKMYDEVTELYRKGGETTSDGTVVARVVDKKIHKVLEEYSADGTVVRSSFFANDKLYCIQEGLETFANGGEKAVKVKISFADDGKLISYKEGFKALAPANWTIAKEIGFNDGKVAFYNEGIEISGRIPRKYAKKLNFEDGKLKFYQEGVETMMGCPENTQKEIEFKDGKPIFYQEGVERIMGPVKKIAKKLEFKDGKPNLCLEGIERQASGTLESAKKYTLGEDGWQEVNK